MNKILLRLIAAGVSLALSAAVVVVSTFAWFTLSSTPEVTGIQMTIADNTIMVAADLSETVDGVTYHYPGVFSDTLNFSQHESYDYLNSLGGMSPVSTADGIHWFVRESEGSDVYEVALADGEAAKFAQDLTLSHANLTSEQPELLSQGSYVYLDFWVVSPAVDYTLRVSTSEEDGGSFLIDLPHAQTDTAGSFALAETSGIASAIARIGFLVNNQQVQDESIRYYWSSENYQDDYTTLRGVYAEPGSAPASDASYRFSIYEPNGDYHPEKEELAGSYLATKPIGWDDNGQVAAVSVSDRTAIQRYSAWKAAPANENQRWIDLIFDAFLTTWDASNQDTEAMTAAFYNNFAGQIGPYVSKGEFVPKGTELGDTVSAEILDELDGEGYNGAAEDVFIVKLERNVPQRIRMFIWLEGQDIDCTNQKTATNFALSLELAGGTE